MNFSTFFIFVFIVVLFVLPSVHQCQTTAIKTFSRLQLNPLLVANKKSDCSEKRLLKMDRYVSKIMTIGKNGRKFPTNKDEVRTYCDETRNMAQFVEATANECFRVEIGNIAKLFLFGLKRMTRQMCSKKKNKKLHLLMNNANCANKRVHLDPCLDQVTNKTRQLVPLNIGNEKIKHMCCYYVDMMRCEDRFLSPCNNPEAKDAWLDLIRSVNEDSLNFACGEYTESTDRCQTLKQPDFSKRDPKIHLDPKYSSFMIAALELFQSLDNFEDL